MIKFTASGKDDFSTFEVSIPGHCGACDQDTDVVILYNPSGLAASLKRRGIDASKTSSLLVYNEKNNRRPIGVTCGCYARWHRQVAHISDSQKRRAAKP